MGSTNAVGRLLTLVRCGLLLIIVHGDIGTDSDVGKNVPEIIHSKGYGVEKHSVTTEDGYILGIFRMLPSRNGKAYEFYGIKKPVVFLQHGLLDSSITWVNNFATQSLGFILTDAGFDVWLGNNRGTEWSSKHVNASTDDDKFWDFSYDEMARYDVPAQLKYILDCTLVDSLAYVGHSQGSTQFLAGLSLARNQFLRPRINLFVALAPVGWVYHQNSFLLKAIARLDLDVAFNLFGRNRFLPSKTILQALAPMFCRRVPIACDDVIFSFCGPSDHINKTRIQVYVSKTPAGTSVKNMVHWGQGIRHDNFQMYDYGWSHNMRIYGKRTPSQYNLTHFNVPTALFYSERDYLADAKDFKRITDVLQPNGLIVYKRNYASYNHLDFVWAEDAHVILYPDLVELLRNRSSSTITEIASK